MVTVLYEGRFLRLLRRDRWEFVQRTPARAVVGIVATTTANELLLVTQHRIPLEQPILELPAGLVGDDPGHADEPILAAAQRELAEETGYRAPNWSVLSRGPTSAGLSDEVLTLVRASDAERTGSGGGVDGEDITVHVIPLADAPGWLAEREAEGLLVDPKVYAALWFIGRSVRA